MPDLWEVPLFRQVLDEILLLFDEERNIARKKYRAFVADGVALGKRDELVGGGLKQHLKYSGTNGHEAYDERVLRSGEFVEYIWHGFKCQSRYMLYCYSEVRVSRRRPVNGTRTVQSRSRSCGETRRKTQHS